MKYLYLFFALFYIQFQSKGAYLILGPMLGHTDDKKALIWCSLDSSSSIEVEISEKMDLSNSRKIIQKDFLTGFIEVNGLKPETNYFYRINFPSRIIKKSQRFLHSSIYKLRTAPVKGTAGRLRFLFSSCSGRLGSDEEESWRAIASQENYDMIFQLGDNHYGDTTNPAIIEKHYIMHRSSSGFRKATGSRPTYGIWDDHDFGPNNSDGQTSGKEGSLEIFKKYWANPAFGEESNPGIYYSFYRGDVQFIMLDSRYHRTPNNSKKNNDPSKTMLGKKQLEWFRQTMKNSTAKIKIVGCGSEFQMYSTGDCFSGFKHEQKIVLDICKNTEGTLLISGDRHFTAAYHVRGETIEVTSGPLGSHNSAPRANPDLFMKHTKGKMYSIMEIDTSAATPKVSLEVYRAGVGQIDKTVFSWDEVNGRTRIKDRKK